MSTPDTSSPSTLVRPDGGPVSATDGDGDDLLTERASATPGTAEADDIEVSAATANVPRAISEGVTGPLTDLQTWFHTVMTHPQTVEDGIAAARPVQDMLQAASPEAILRPTDKMTVAERMRIYHRGYQLRLGDCLVDDFDTVQAAVGEDTFERLCAEYIETHPSLIKSLNFYGARFPEFLRHVEWLEHAAFAADLARLEWTIIERIHAPYGQTLDVTQLQALPPEAWGQVRLHPSPDLKVVCFDYPVSPYFTQVMRNESPTIPAPGWSATAVYRYNDRVWRMELTKATHTLLQALIEGTPLGAALARLEDAELAKETEALETDVMKWFQEWMQNGFFEKLDVVEA